LPQQARIADARLGLSDSSQFHVEQPFVAIVEQQRHPVSNLWEPSRDADRLDPKGVFIGGIAQVGKQFVSRVRPLHTASRPGIETKRMIEIKPERPQGEGGEIVQ